MAARLDGGAAINNLAALFDYAVLNLGVVYEAVVYFRMLTTARWETVVRTHSCLGLFLILSYHNSPAFSFSFSKSNVQHNLCFFQASGVFLGVLAIWVWLELLSSCHNEVAISSVQNYGGLALTT